MKVVWTSSSGKPLNDVLKPKHFAVKGIKRNWEKHQFHLVDNSQLPILMSLSTMLVALSIVFYWHPSEVDAVVWLDNVVMHISFIMFTSTMISWFIMVVRESQAGHHTAVVQQGLRLGVVLFIVSEVMFFFAFFWAYFHYATSPSIFIGCTWPPMGIQPLDPWGLPLTNTLLLLSSGVTITFAHKTIVKAHTSYHQRAFMKYLLCTIILGITFLACQFIEYKYGITFSWKENVYGSIFFILTGFHGFHVTFGTMFLWFCWARAVISRAGLLLRPLVRFMLRIFLSPNIPTPKKIITKLHNILKNNATAKKIHDKFAPKKKNTTVKKTEVTSMPPIEEMFVLATKEYEVQEEDEIEYMIVEMEAPYENDVEYFSKLKSKRGQKIDLQYEEDKLCTWLKTFGFTPKQHIGFEAAAWYWHFVDVVWLFLYIVVYLW